MVRDAKLEQPAPSLRPHAAFVMYLSLLCYLLFSVHLASGWHYFPELILYVLVLLASYALAWRVIPGRGLDSVLSAVRLTTREITIAWALLAAATSFVVAHYVHLGRVPVVTAFFDTDYFSVMFIRQEIFEDASALWRYAPNILIKSIFPFLLFYFSGRSVAGFRTTFLISSLYAISLLNKMFVVLVVLPALVVSLLHFRIWRAALLSVVPVMSMAFLVLVQNPQMRPEAWVAGAKHIAEYAGLQYNGEKSWDWSGLKRNSSAAAAPVESARVEVPIDRSAPGARTIDTIKRRVVDVPGQVITAWFDNIPSKLPFAYGCGYRWLAPMLGCERQSFPTLIDQIQNPHLAQIGVRGSMTAASFMEDYANFGRAGLVVSAVVLALLLVVNAAIFRNDWRANLALSITPMLLLLEIQLTTVILTGGWLFTVLLYILLSRPASDPEADRHT